MKKSHSELRNSITEMKNIMEGMNSRLLEVQESVKWKIENRKTTKLRNRGKRILKMRRY